jgi:biotin carboxyl carrier protein
MEMRLRQGDRLRTVAIAEDADGARAEVDGAAYRLRRIAAHASRTADGTPVADLVVAVGGRIVRACVVRTGDRLLVAFDGGAHTVDLGDAPPRGGAAGGVGTVVAPMPGKIVQVLVAVGDAVEPGQPLVVLEAMKMETTLRSEVAGTVASVPVAPAETVDAGAVLVEVTASPQPIRRIV